MRTHGSDPLRGIKDLFLFKVVEIGRIARDEDGGTAGSSQEK